MKKTGFLAAALCLSIAALAQGQIKPAIPYNAEIEAKVEALLSKMTLEQKIGQMCEITVDVATDWSDRSSWKVSQEGMKKLFDDYKVGSILNVPLSFAQTPQAWAEGIRQLNIASEKASGIAQIYGVDQMHGTTYTYGGTLFPQSINQAASFNKEFPFQVAEICAYESKACLIPWIYAPVMDLGRQPMWSRMWESFGEDPLLNSVMAVQAVKGFQGTDPNHIDDFHAAACLKHYIAYGVPVNGKDRTPSSVSERELREKYFEPFKNCAKAGALSIMVNSANNNGMPVHANHRLLTEWFKEGLNWDGMIVTDWADITNLWNRDHIAADKKEAVELAINAGIDMSMDPYSTDFCDLLKELVNEGRVKMSRIDDAVRRILRLKFRLRLDDQKTWNIDYAKLAQKYPEFGSEKSAALATRMAEESIVLLKNTDNILPLKKGVKILVTGPNSNNLRPQNGGWSYTWQGDGSVRVHEELGYKTFYEAIRDKFGAENVTLAEGMTYQNGGMQVNFELENEPNIEAAVKAAANVDVIVAVVGENSYAETPGNLSDFNLSPTQKQLVKELAKTGKPIVLVLNEGRPRIIKDIEPLSKATIDALLPSNYGGIALANLLAGDANFSAKMPFTYPGSINSLSTYDFKPGESVSTMSGNYNYDAKIDALYEFGFGLSYTTFNYSNLKLDKTSFTANDELTFTVDVTNTGKVAGKEPVLLFISDLVASITPDNKRLRAFDKIALNPGETKTVTLKVKGSDLAFVGYDEKWVLEKGEFRAKVGDQALNFSCSETKKWDTPNREDEN
ncbi:MAG: glycoside hydrolase family 3 C-terminal domain-containing protein [Bacteroidaceae bacterium]|nr:glycoside hydrolase family 3 C-terminal domain-containing protein [Bacteroidaceae bacterium]